MQDLAKKIRKKRGQEHSGSRSGLLYASDSENEAENKRAENMRISQNEGVRSSIHVVEIGDLRVKIQGLKRELKMEKEKNISIEEITQMVEKKDAKIEILLIQLQNMKEKIADLQRSEYTETATEQESRLDDFEDFEQSEIMHSESRLKSIQ